MKLIIIINFCIAIDYGVLLMDIRKKVQMGSLSIWISNGFVILHCRKAIQIPEIRFISENNDSHMIGLGFKDIESTN